MPRTEDANDDTLRLVSMTLALFCPFFCCIWVQDRGFSKKTKKTGRSFFRNWKDAVVSHSVGLMH